VKDAAIVTLFDFLNIGNKLQNYALQELINSLGWNATTIVNKDLLYKSNLKTKVKGVIGKYIPRYRRQYLDKKRRQVFYEKTRNLINSTNGVSYQEIVQNEYKYDAYIVGSDQVWYKWSNVSTEMPYRFLQFTDKKKRICFAPSFGKDEILENEREEYKLWLCGFERYSAREATGCSIIKNITGKKAELLCDPTLIVSSKVWSELEKHPSYDVPLNYILLYFLSEITDEQKKVICNLAKKYNYKIIDIYNKNYPQYYNTTPQEFLYLIKNARYVFTNSFHGTVFSIIYHKDFSVFTRDKSGARMNNRCITLLDTFGLMKCLNSSEKKEIDWKAVDDVLETEREKGILYLENELSRIEHYDAHKDRKR